MNLQASAEDKKMKELPAEVQDYIDLVRSGKYAVCQDQLDLISLVEDVCYNEDVYFDLEQLKSYMALQVHFPYKLFEWEKFCFALHNCLYRADGLLRFPILIIYVGRGAGKNGYLSFEDFALLTPVNGIKKYDIYTFATSEDQAKRSWGDVYDILESNPQKYRKYFYWTKEVITNLKTNSSWYYCTSSAKTKDGQRPGKVDHDEEHAYDNSKLIDVAVTGLGKVAHPRRTVTTTDGLIRGGPLDSDKETGRKILSREIPDNGVLFFSCHIEDENEINDERNWYKANPSLQYMPHLLAEMRIEYVSYRNNPAENVSFTAKRMNYPPRILENEVAKWDDILATDRPIDESKLIGKCCVGGIDYAKTIDMVAAGLLFCVDGEDIWIPHAWVCSNSPDLKRINAPLRLWESQGLLTFVEAAEIPPELATTWLANTAARLNATVLKIGIDKFRYSLMKKALNDIFFSADKDIGNVILVGARDEMLKIPTITSKFVNHRIVWGNNPFMRWCAGNSKTQMTNAGNMTYQKIEPKSRKTDGFKAFAAAECVSDVLEELDNGELFIDNNVYSY